MRNNILIVLLLSCVILKSQQKWDERIKLDYSDFQAEIGDTSLYGGYTHSGFGYALIGDTVFCDARFNQEKSWINESLGKGVLEHEQVHFDISELYSRIFKSTLNHQSWCYNNIITDINMVLDSVGFEMQVKQREWDRVSEYHNTPEKEDSFLVSLNKSMDSLIEYSEGYVILKFNDYCTEIRRFGNGALRGIKGYEVFNEKGKEYRVWSGYSVKYYSNGIKEDSAYYSTKFLKGYPGGENYCYTYTLSGRIKTCEVWEFPVYKNEMQKGFILRLPEYKYTNHTMNLFKNDVCIEQYTLAEGKRSGPRYLMTIYGDIKKVKFYKMGKKKKTYKGEEAVEFVNEYPPMFLEHNKKVQKERAAKLDEVFFGE